MSTRGPESKFIAKVHKRLESRPGKSPHIEKMHNPYRRGHPDVFYSGDKGCMWIEYKWSKISNPKEKEVNLRKLGASDNQIEWMKSRSLEGRTVYLVSGFENTDCVVLIHPVKNTKRFLNNIEELAQFIYGLVGDRKDAKKDDGTKVENDSGG
jgi:hypothetical protein